MISHNPEVSLNDIQVRAAPKILPGAAYEDNIPRIFHCSSQWDPTSEPDSDEVEIVVEINALGKKILVCINKEETGVSWAHLNALQNPQSHEVMPLV